MLAKGLREHAYAVDIAPDGGTALEQIESTDYDLVILDILLPRINGLDLCRQLRADESAVPVLMLTARGGLDDRVEGLDAGADDYLSKPYHFPELLARVARCCVAAPLTSARSSRSTIWWSTPAPVAHARGNGDPADDQGIRAAGVPGAAAGAGRDPQRDRGACVGRQFDPMSNLIEVYIQRLRRKIDEATRSG